ncbi:RidA family protein [Mucilaginibacter sp.]|uniref:RidA family protein n=1 Tax=Mucilaginibacter sp. TaxID=1882438 RepID=UPI00261253F1|nr:RidA family protein [Mucilaginibacter sp.]MDB5031114.1 RidA family protein [Mucilaginibacter sp.]
MKESIKIIKVEGAPAPAGHYSPGIAYNGMLFISGQLPVRADGTHTNTEPFEVQARQTIQNVLAILKAAGSDASDLLKVTVYVVGIENWKIFNQIYIEMMGDAKPARAVVPVPELHHGYLIEIEATAAV